MKLLLILILSAMILVPQNLHYVPKIDAENFSEIPDPTVSLNPDVSSQINIEKLNKLILPFIENQGQIHPEVKYYAKTFAGTIYVTNDDLTYYSISKDKDTDSTKSLAIKEKFLGASLSPIGIQKSESTVNYFVGKQENWHNDIPTYDIVNLGTIWPSVNVNLQAHGNNVEKIFIVLPGGSIQDIKMKIDGISGLSLSDNGELVINSELGKMSFTNPIAFQYKDLEKFYVNATYEIIDSQTYGFKIKNYDPQLPLVIDPLVSSTFIGGSGTDISYDLRRDSSGNVFVTGSTTSSGFPTTSGAYDTSYNDDVDEDAFVSKFNSNLSTLMASTFIGGNFSDGGTSISVDGSGNVFITGFTGSSGFPTTSGAYDTSYNGGTKDAFVSKFSSNLSSLSASTFIGGSSGDEPNEIKLDGSGNVFITGDTTSSGFPTTSGAYNTSFSGGDDAFVSKLNSTLSTLIASTFIGGTGVDHGDSLSIDNPGHVFVTGHADSSSFPTTSGAYDTSYNGGTEDAIVSKFNSNLSTLMASTFIGGSGSDIGHDVELDSSGNVFVTGATGSSGYPTTSGAYDTSSNGGTDVFVSKLDNMLSSLSASTFIGGSSTDTTLDMNLDSSANAYITGHTASSNYPTTSGAFDTTHAGGGEVFVSKFSSNLSSLSASTFIGSSGDDIGNAIVLDDAANAYVTGYTNSSGYPTTSGAYDTSFNSGTYDGFVTIIDCNLDGTGICLTDDGSVSITVSAGGTATVIAPEGNTVSITLPAGVSGTVTFTDTTAGAATASTLGFLGSVVDITITAVGTKTVSFTFTQAQADAVGVTPSEAKIYEDINEDGSFQTNEALETTVTGSGPFTATASSDFQSKFSVGGVIRANVLAGVAATLGIIEKSSCDPDGFGTGISLKLYKISYDVVSANRLWAEARSTCGPMILQIVSDGKISAGGISNDQPRLDERIVRLEAPLDADQKSFSIVLKDKRDFITQNFYISKLIYEKDYTKVEQWSSQVNNTNTVSNTTSVIPSDSKDVIPSWIRNNARWWSDNSIEDADFVQGIQYLVKNGIVQIPQTNEITSEVSQQIPAWIKSNAGWWADSLISDDDFIKGIQWLISNGIIKVS